ncbi:hypothetical protein EUX98_g4720 [Antrodiella citrinella]|uniref:Branched-chain alpha-ketoacid dehydrogenase kinase/Pyruvate dehydrogenase kinase N-terminal domain-containing protein n=1 Tax=Antrodiella citrinella TaxID=2447956 RepID=A0A4S4MU71_9APHY|nr:hypothetical protein EUX98_g4720 [Antrodiella citrinella]
MSMLAMLRTFIDQSYPPAPTFTEADVPDLAGKVVLVTGGNTGIGKETVRVVLEHGARVYLACRSEEKGKAAVKELLDLTGKTELFLLSLDLSSFASIRNCADELKRKETKLDVLFNNAGLMAPPIQQLTAEGYDMTFGTNVVGPYLLTKLLHPLLQAAAAEHHDARVVHTSSLGHAAGPKPCITWESLKPGEPGENKRRSMGPDNLYYQSKAGVIMVANELARRYGDEGIIHMSLHPGTIKSELGRNWPLSQRISYSLFIRLKPTALGAITQLYAGTSPEGKHLNGKYLIPWARVGKSRDDMQDEKISGRLWEWLEEQTAAVATYRSFSPAEGAVWAESESGHSTESESVPARVKELDELPHNVGDMPSIAKVKNWYAQSFDELIHFPSMLSLPSHIRNALLVQPPDHHQLPESTPNPSLMFMNDDFASMALGYERCQDDRRT